MAISTTNSHVSRAVDFFAKDEIFFAIGRTSPWPVDENGKTEMDVGFEPPFENRDAVSLEQIIGYKKVETMYLVAPDDNGAISYQETKWKVVPADQAYAQKARFVFLETTLRYDELPLGFYRQVGIYTGLERAVGVTSGKFNLIPSEVLTSGTLEVIDNRGPSNRQVDQKEVINIIIEF